MFRFAALFGPLLAVFALLLCAPATRAQGGFPIRNQAAYAYAVAGEDGGPAGPVIAAGIRSPSTELIDPRGQIRGCHGELLPDYQGFSVGLYEPDPTDPTLTEARGPVLLTRTEFPDAPGNSVPAGISPNVENNNPFFLTNADGGTYSFLFDAGRGQLNAGRVYLLLVNPPAGSRYVPRRVRIVLGERRGDTVAYTATALDGLPLQATNGALSVNQTLHIGDGATVGLTLAVMNLNLTACEAHEMSILKTCDRASAEPGDTLVYRVTVRNTGEEGALGALEVADDLPRGFRLLPRSVRADLDGSPVPVTTTGSLGRVIFAFGSAVTLRPRQSLRLVYATLLTPDALQGTGINAASVRALLAMDQNDLAASPGSPLAAGPATYAVRVRQGLLSDAGTLIGRVFVDANNDGEQQKGEPGVPDAVVLLDDGNRITTDANGLFSVANVLCGWRAGILDPSSLPAGLVLSPGRFRERQSASRLVRLEPGGLARMNFAVAAVASTAAKGGAR